ncbi:hypothetical protein N5W20_08880 [Candidatus Kirkpatrickella diaphorinae]|uniref:Urease accessory protein UreH-like transmembrane domain-containing protein n=1 Tax=Candidatus Kirkpatrickella diaphorinae TaxID=2984322 RepID=A0ABY6GI46_9PROT|nr:hypothetical protein [Candidatus Kirkpatrickella diaphorinae]UYH51187.1 hypothetical protein N5W20_08880 [Candidatus Kirkpatrickella diaphorinae]
MMPVFSLLIAATLLGIGGGYHVLILNAFFSASLAVIFRTSQLGVMTGILILLLNIVTAIFLRAAVYQDVTSETEGRDGVRRFLARAGAVGLAFPLAMQCPIFTPTGVALMIMISGIASIILKQPAAQFIGLFCAMNGLLLLSALTAQATFVYVASSVWCGLFIIARLSLPKVSWPPLEGGYRD